MKQKRKIIATIIIIAAVELFKMGSKKIDVPMNSDTQKTESSEEANNKKENDMQTITLTVKGQVLRANLEDNSSADALVKLLKKGSINVDMSDYASMEKVGDLGSTLPSNNKQITTEAGDLILYMGNKFVIYYAPNSWNLTRLGKIQNVGANELKKILGKGDVTVTVSLGE